MHIFLVFYSYICYNTCEKKKLLLASKEAEKTVRRWILMTKYEIMFIVKSTLDEETIKKTSEDLQKLINKKPSKVIEFKEMGRKKLAYPIKKEVSGYYYVMTVEVTNETLQEFDRKVSINENVLRHLIIKVEGE